MANISLTQQVRELDTSLRESLSSLDIDSLPLHERDLIALIKRQVSDVRLDARDYEYAESRDEQLRYGKEARERLKALEENIVKASQQNVFGAISVVQLSTQIQQLMKQMD